MKSQMMEANEWATVKRRRPHTDAIVIESRSDLSNADILRKVKEDLTLSGLRDNVTRIRSTQKEKVLLELRKTQDERTFNHN